MRSSGAIWGSWPALGPLLGALGTLFFPPLDYELHYATSVKRQAPKCKTRKGARFYALGGSRFRHHNCNDITFLHFAKSPCHDNLFSCRGAFGAAAKIVLPLRKVLSRKALCAKVRAIYGLACGSKKSISKASTQLMK